MREEDIYQIFITGTGEYLSELLTKGLGGVIFFSKDILSESEIKDKISEIKRISKIPPFLSIDQEGGRVERTENIYPKRLSAKYAYEKGIEYLKSQTNELAIELVNFGINLNFAPVIDVNTNPLNPIIGERAFSDTPKDVIIGMRVVNEVYKQHGIISCVKHYPGHGDAQADSHKELPKIDLSLDEMERIHLLPFKAAVEDGVFMVMIGHLNCKCFGEYGIATSLSSKAIDYLRNNLGFSGVIISDDMNMGGLSGLTTFEASLKAIKAGVNILLYRDSNEATYLLINELVKQIKEDSELKYSVEASIEKIRDLKRLYKVQ